MCGLTRKSAQNPDAPSLTLADGTVMNADIVIAADGVHSLAVEAVLSQPNPAVPSSKMDNDNFCYRFLIPAAEIEADPETQFWNDNSDGVNRFLVGEGKRIVSYPCRKYVLYLFEDISELTVYAGG